MRNSSSPAQTSLRETRGYRKIFDACRAFRVDFRGKTVLDIGSSTGGFTQFALDHDAKKVIAVERGTNQMQAPLHFRSEVELHEKTDIFSFDLACSAPDLILADVSFISLIQVLSYAKLHLSDPHTEFLVMLKPQFEARADQLVKGVVKNSKIRREIIKNFETWLKSHGFIILDKCDNRLSGRTGNLERFYYLRLETPRKTIDQ